MQVELLPHAFFNLKDGGKMRYARFEPAGAARGTVLILPGRREFIEKKFFELGQPLLNNGLSVIIVEPRGQGLSSRFLSGNLYQRDHIEDFDHHLNDLRAFFAAIVAPNLVAPLFLHGHSMGGHLILRWLTEDHPPATAAFLTSPMLALNAGPAHLAAQGISWFTVKLLGHAQEYAPMQHDFGGEDCVFTNNVLTHDADRFPIIEKYFATFPDLAVGGVTWGWLLAALKSMQQTHAMPYLGRIDIPVLALTGSEDKVTPTKDIMPCLNFVPRVRPFVMEGARHDILNEIDAIRSEAWAKIDAFLKEFMSA